MLMCTKSVIRWACNLTGHTNHDRDIGCGCGWLEIYLSSPCELEVHQACPVHQHGDRGRDKPVKGRGAGERDGSLESGVRRED